MAELVATGQTTLPREEVIVRAVHFFTNERWRAQSQSERIATFVGRPPIPWGLVFLTIIGFLFFIIPGVIMYILVVRRVIRFQNIVVTANPLTAGAEVVVTHPKAARKLVVRFLSVLPPVPASAVVYSAKGEQVALSAPALKKTKVPAAAYCSQCGRKIAGDSKFCEECGSPVHDVS